MIGHKRDRHQVWYDGVSFRAPCRRCGIDLARDHRRGWVVFDPKTDPHVAHRTTKP
ncbi:hypothetical protein [Sphingomonas sp. VNH70]|uniref:hypothetical protein n=1 Tax=Sphingomonas silueang TaxID=3156617 RepID=UPI0032B38C40